MKTMKKNLLLSVFTLIAALCFATALIFATNTGKVVKADGEPALNATKFSVSTSGDYMLLATPITGSVADIYEVGYDFTGTQPTLEQHNTKTYYTSINGKGAHTLFGDPYTDSTPMIVWEVANDGSITDATSYTAYIKVGERVGDVLYPNAGNVKTQGTARNLKTYTVTWKDNSKGKADKVQKVAYNEKPSFPWRYFEVHGSENYIYSYKVEQSTDGKTWTDASNWVGAYGASTIRPWGADQGDFNDGLSAVTGNVQYKVTYKNECPIVELNSDNSNFAVAQTADSKTFTFTNAANDGSSNTFKVHGDLNIYHFEHENQYLAIKVEATGDASATLTVKGTSGTGSVIIPAFYMEDWNASADHYAVDVKMTSGTATGFTATLAFVNGTASDITAVENNYNTNFANYKGINLENFRSTTTKISSFETALSGANWTSQSVLLRSDRVARVAAIKSSFTVVDEMTIVSHVTKSAKLDGPYTGYSNAKYGNIWSVGALNGGKHTILYNQTPDLSEYDFVLIGWFNTGSAFNLVTSKNDTYIYPGMPTRNNNNGDDCVTVVRTVSQFMNDGFGWYSTSTQRFTAIVAVKGEALRLPLDNYSTKFAELGVNASDALVIDSMAGYISDRFTISGTGLNSTTVDLINPYQTSTYGYMGSAGKTTGLVGFKWKNKDNLDLSGYTHVLIALKNNTNAAQNWVDGNGAGTVRYQDGLAASGFTVLQMTVEQFTTYGFGTWQGSGNIWFGPIIAVSV